MPTITDCWGVEVVVEYSAEERELVRLNAKLQEIEGHWYGSIEEQEGGDIEDAPGYRATMDALAAIML